MKLIVGLGNVGPRYRDTRHNVGFRVIDALADRHGVSVSQRWTAHRQLAALFGEATIGPERVRLMQPQTMMNASGEALAAARDWDVAPADVLIVYDDVNLPLGTLRARPAGGPGGHHGLMSCLVALGTEEVPRLRIGVGTEPLPRDLTDMVLSKFTPAERPVAERAIARAADAGEWWVRSGIQDMMNRANRTPTSGTDVKGTD